MDQMDHRWIEWIIDGLNGSSMERMDQQWIEWISNGSMDDTNIVNLIASRILKIYHTTFEKKSFVESQ